MPAKLDYIVSIQKQQRNQNYLLRNKLIKCLENPRIATKEVLTKATNAQNLMHYELKIKCKWHAQQIEFVPASYATTKTKNRSSR